jgi:hypothetical protein
MQHLKDAKELNTEFLKRQKIIKVIYDTLMCDDITRSKEELETETVFNIALTDMEDFLESIADNIYIKDPESDLYNGLYFETDYSMVNDCYIEGTPYSFASLFDYIKTSYENKSDFSQTEEDLISEEKCIKRTYYYVYGITHPKLY